MLNLVQLQERLKGIPMQALMQYANGSNPQVPPFLALGELNRRKKMQSEAAAEQAQAMEGAPSVKDQIEQEAMGLNQAKEQAAGLLALQGSRQRQAAQQQQAAQQTMPMAAPNTTTSEPAQMAGGGFVDDVVVPRDYQIGGQVQPQINPEMLKRLMMLKAMKQRQGLQGIRPDAGMNAPRGYADGGNVIDPEDLKRAMYKEAMQGDIADIPKELIGAARKSALRRAPGLPSLSMSKDMFKRADYAGGGIVAFAGPEGSFVESSPGFYQLAEEVPGQEQAPTDIKQLFAELIRKQQQRKSLAERLKEANLELPPEPGREELMEIQRSMAEQKAQAPMDQLTAFLSGITEGRGGNWATQGARGAKAAVELEAKQRAGMSALSQQMAKIKDLREKAKYESERGNITAAMADEDLADKTQADLIAKMSEAGYKEKLGDREKTSNLTYMTQVIDEARRNPTPENIRRMQSVIEAAQYTAPLAGPRIESQGDIARQQIDATNARDALESTRKMLTIEGLVSNRELASRLNQARKDDPSGVTERQIKLDVLNQNRASQNPPLPPLRQLPADLIAPGKTSAAPSQAAPQQAPATGGLPPQAVSQLKEGTITTFANGQKWTIKDGKPQQVQ